MQQIKRGFTLIETLVALAILTVALGASVTLTRTIYVQAQKSGDISQMNSLASESIANLRFMRNDAYKHASNLHDKLGPGLTLGNGHFTLDPTIGLLKWKAIDNVNFDVAVRKAGTESTTCVGYVQNYQENNAPSACAISHENWDVYQRQIRIDPVDGNVSLYAISVIVTNTSTGTSVSRSAVVGDVDPNMDISSASGSGGSPIVCANSFSENHRVVPYTGSQPRYYDREIQLTYTVCNTSTVAISPIVKGTLPYGGSTEMARIDNFEVPSRTTISQGQVPVWNWQSPTLQRRLDPTRDGLDLISWSVGSLASNTSATITMLISVSSVMPANATAQITSNWNVDKPAPLTLPNLFVTF